jgi:hypothetical protein
MQMPCLQADLAGDRRGKPLRTPEIDRSKGKMARFESASEEIAIPRSERDDRVCGTRLAAQSPVFSRMPPEPTHDQRPGLKYLVGRKVLATEVTERRDGFSGARACREVGW